MPFADATVYCEIKAANCKKLHNEFHNETKSSRLQMELWDVHFRDGERLFGTSKKRGFTAAPCLNWNF